MALTFEELREANRLREADKVDNMRDWSPSDRMLGTIGELGELAYEMTQHTVGQGRDLGIEHELADVVIFLGLLAASLDIDLGNAVRERFDLLSEEAGSVVRLAETAEERIP